MATTPPIDDNRIDPNIVTDPGDGVVVPPEAVVAPPPPEVDSPAPPILDTNFRDPGATTTPTDTGGADIAGSPGTPPLLPPPEAEAPDDTGLPTATTREVGDNELVENRLTGLLDSDSRYIRQARQQGLELGGGLGGSVGMRATYGAAIAAGLPIATADAQAFRDAASENMAALNEFGLANLQRRTQLDLGVLDANTRLTTTHMNNVAQTNIARMEDITNRDIARLTAATQIRVTELNGQIQARLADAEFRHSQILNNELAGYDLERAALAGEYNLAGTDLQGQYNLEQEAMRLDQSRENNYINSYMVTYDSALTRITSLNGLDIDDNARLRAEDAIWEGFYAQVDLLHSLYPEVTPMTQPEG